MFLAECVGFRVLSGSFWWRLNIIHLEEQRVLTNLAADYYPRALFRIRQLDFSAQEGHFGLLAYLFLASFPALLWSRSRRALALWASVLLIMLWFQYGIMTLEGRSIAKWIRYLIVLLPFASLACSEALLSVGRRGGHLMVSGLLGVLISTNLLSANDAQNANAEQLRDFKATAAVIRRSTVELRFLSARARWGFLGRLSGQTAAAAGPGTGGHLGSRRLLRGPVRIPQRPGESGRAIEDGRLRAGGSWRVEGDRDDSRRRYRHLRAVRPDDLLRALAPLEPAPAAGDHHRSEGRCDLGPRRHCHPAVRARRAGSGRLDRFGAADAGIRVDVQRSDSAAGARRSRAGVPLALDHGRIGFGGLLPDFLVRLAWDSAGVGLFVDDGRANNPFTFDDSCRIQQSYRIDGATARAIVPIRCFRKAGEEISESSFKLKATFEAASVVNGRWIGRDIGGVVTIPGDAGP